METRTPVCGGCGLCYALPPLFICGHCWQQRRGATRSQVTYMVARVRRGGHAVGAIVPGSAHDRAVQAAHR